MNLKMTENKIEKITYEIHKEPYDELIQACTSNNFFNIFLKTKDGYIFFIVDTQKKRTSNEKKLITHTNSLLERFVSIKKWYNC